MRRRELSNGVDEEQRDIRLPSASECFDFLTTGGSALPTYRENWLCSLFCVVVISRKNVLWSFSFPIHFSSLPCKVVHFIVC